MESFFNRFPDFTYNPRRPHEEEFRRLQHAQQWSTDQPVYKRNRRLFFSTLLQVSNTPLNVFFIHHYPTFIEYDCTASPAVEFRRLREHYGWDVGTRPYRRARKLYEEAFEETFDGPINDFFNAFPAFEYNPRNQSIEEFRRLMIFQGWNREDGAYKDASKRFFEAVQEEFNRIFGEDDDDIEGWCYLCEVLGVDNRPSSAKECKKALRNVHVNIFDLLQYERQALAGEPNEPLRKFETVEKLASYSRGKWYPRTEAKRGSLKYMLRCIAAGERSKKVQSRARS